MLRRITFSLALVALLSTTAPAQERPTSALGGAVTFKLPESWVVQQYSNTETNGFVRASIPYAAAEKAKQKAEVVLGARLVGEAVTLGHESDGVSKNKFEGMAVLSDTLDEGGWRTLVWTFRADGTSFLVLNRFGVAGGKSVELRAALPLVAGGDTKWVERAVTDFNSACESLKIGGSNRFEHKVTLDKFAGMLKVTNR